MTLMQCFPFWVALQMAERYKHFPFAGGTIETVTEAQYLGSHNINKWNYEPKHEGKNKNGA